MSDLIKREDAIMALRLEYPMMPMFKELREEWAVKTEGYRKAEEIIMRLPSADRPSGEWIRAEEIDIAWGSIAYTCFNCGHKQDDKTNFCCECGADMRKESE